MKAEVNASEVKNQHLTSLLAGSSLTFAVCIGISLKISSSIYSSPLLFACINSSESQFLEREMAVPEVNKELFGELEAMGFPIAQATRALHYSGNSSLESAIGWLLDHEDDPEINQMPLVPVTIEIEASNPLNITEAVKLKAQELRDRARRRKEEEEKKMEREREKKRIRAGKDFLEAKRIEEENERKRFIALWKVEKEEENRARNRIRQKLLQDKEERKLRLGLPPEERASFEPATLMRQEEEKETSDKSTRLLVKFATKAELIRNCLRSLRRNHKDKDAKVKRAFRTLLIYIGNVARNPDEEKYRKIRLSNPLFQDRIGGFEEGIEFLELCGFERVEEGKFLYLPQDNIDLEVFRSAGTELQSAITNPFFGLLSK